jgi:hypothetical protein
VKLSLDAKKSLAEATIAYHAQVGVIAEYLAARGISKQSADMYRLGYVKEPLVGHEQYEGRLAIPYLTPTGPVDLRFRQVVDDGSPKYLSRPGAEGHLFGVNAFQIDSDHIAICEGELDTIITHGECGVPAIGIPDRTGGRTGIGVPSRITGKCSCSATGTRPVGTWGRRSLSRLMWLWSCQCPIQQT